MARKPMHRRFPTPDPVARSLLDRRIALGLMQSDVAALAGTRPELVSMMEIGRRQSRELRARIDAALSAAEAKR